MKRHIRLLLMVLFAALLHGIADAQSAGSSQYVLEQSVIASGGGQNSSGGVFTLDGTIGQAIAGTTSITESFTVFSGFWTTSAFFMPIADNQTVAAIEDTPVNITLSASDPNNSSLTYIIVTDPAHGTLSGTGANLTFTPVADYFGADEFTFKVTNGTTESENAVVTINIAEVNDTPVAANDEKTTAQDTTLIFAASDLTANDKPGPSNENNQILTVTEVITTAQTNGYVSLNSGQITFQPTAGFSGTTNFNYQVCDNGTTGGQTVPKCATAAVTVFVTQTQPSFYSIAGTVFYGTTPEGQAAKPVADVLMSATGTNSALFNTDSSGNYSLSNLLSGNYSVTPTKSGEVNSISSFDAALTARKAANLISLTPNQMIAADVSGNGEVSSFDASLIARTIVGISNTGTAGQWKFVPASRNYSNLTENQTAQNYEAVLMGEVSGNWTASNSSPEQASPTAAEILESDRIEERKYEETQKLFGANRQIDGFVKGGGLALEKRNSRHTDRMPAQAGIAVSLPAGSTASNGTIVIPVTVGDVTARDIFSFDFTVTFDKNVLKPAAAVFDMTDTLSGAAGFIITPDASIAGRLTISGFGTQALAGQGTLMFLRFNVVGTASSTTNLTFDSFGFNEGDPAAKTTRGAFTVLGPTMGGVLLSGRVLTPQGRGLQNAQINLTDQNGETRFALSGQFGFYRFADLPAGQTVVISISSKRYQFIPQIVNLTEDLNNLNFTALP